MKRIFALLAVLALLSPTQVNAAQTRTSPTPMAHQIETFHSAQDVIVTEIQTIIMYFSPANKTLTASTRQAMAHDWVRTIDIDDSFVYNVAWSDKFAKQTIRLPGDFYPYAPYMKLHEAYDDLHNFWLSIQTTHGVLTFPAIRLVEDAMHAIVTTKSILPLPPYDWSSTTPGPGFLA